MYRSIPKKRSSASISRILNRIRRCWCVYAAVLSATLALPASADHIEGASDAYYRLAYDFEVAHFCGLVNADVHAAYQAKRGRLEASERRTPERLTRLRIHAMADAEREYANRGLGGYKPWCLRDGRDGVRRIVGP